MKYLFFDTETTGLPMNYYAPAIDTNNWPRLVQLSYIITDDLGNVISTKDFMLCKTCRTKEQRREKIIEQMAIEEERKERDPQYVSPKNGSISS